MTRPASVAPVASRDGGGGTVGCTGVPTLEFLASDVCCSARGTSGAGETACVRPTLISPNLWINAACTTGGGAITACGNVEDWVIFPLKLKLGRNDNSLSTIVRLRWHRNN